MKQIILLIVVLSFIHCAPKKTVGNPTNPKIKSIVENNKLNVVYRGIRNPLTIYVPNTDSIKVSGIGLHKIDNNEYYISPGQGLTMEITIVGYIKGQEIIDKREFRILDIQKPYASIHKYFGNVTLSKEKLASSKIKPHIPQFVLELPDVYSFEYQINNQKRLFNEGNTFNDVAKKQIYNLKKGDSVLIDNVKLVTDRPNVDRAKIIELKVYIE
ncbi:hypothetical protein BWZ20_00325 [Winogradskyella sp. J14-2]|uniref:GldM family protein n=1 Tax=Winogradskyella sp. J14-2 TaxID=1936080 RepID=UPI0009729EE0|nr:GldM family protein [Winogradskyella sp. J14-2]APY06833.1 hypothetical protein BWZ20_00325 [Winogradskyella sp. J14-2]